MRMICLTQTNLLRSRINAFLSRDCLLVQLPAEEYQTVARSSCGPDRACRVATAHVTYGLREASVCTGGVSAGRALSRPPHNYRDTAPLARAVLDAPFVVEPTRKEAARQHACPFHNISEDK